MVEQKKIPPPGWGPKDFMTWHHALSSHSSGFKSFIEPAAQPDKHPKIGKIGKIGIPNGPIDLPLS